MTRDAIDHSLTTRSSDHPSEWAYGVLSLRFGLLNRLENEPEEALRWCCRNTDLRNCWCSLAFRSWQPACRSLEDMARAATDRRAPLPRWLQRTLHESPPRSARRGRRNTCLARDAIIAATVIDVCKRYDLRPYRNAATTQVCGCSVVQKALGQLHINLALDTINKIVGRSGNFARVFTRTLDEIARDMPNDIDGAVC